MITDETVAYAAALAKLEFSDSGRERAKKALCEILGYIETMNELDTEGVEPMMHIYPVINVFREDAVTNGEERENLLANAPDRSGDSFRVPRTVE